MSKPMPSSKDNTLTVVEELIEMGKLDTLFRDLYLQRARTLLAPVFSRGSYLRLQENTAQLPWLEQQLRAGVERGDWKRCADLTTRLRDVRTAIEGKAQFAKVAETIYEKAADVSVDVFSSGLNVLVGVPTENVQSLRADALNLLLKLERNDPQKKDFYARRVSNFKQLSIVTDVSEKPKEERVDAAQLQQAALGALDAGDLSKLDQILASFNQQPAADQKQEETIDSNPAAAITDLGDDLLYNFAEQTLAAARELGLTPVRTQSRRQFAYLLPHGWQPSFRKDEVKKWSKEKISRLTFPADTPEGAREAIDFYLLNPFINSCGTRYRVCLVAEDLLLEDFPEPEIRTDETSALLNKLKLNTRWGLSRIEIEDALLEHGHEVLEEVQLDPEHFRLTVIPADLYTHLGPQRGWGQREMWTHFDGYRVLEGGKLQALAGGDRRFGGSHDVVSFSPDYASGKVMARFALVQRKRMMDWQNQRTP
ncbi:MAG TPA: hypothetical protein VGD38_02170 [Pyrinomonadaceae bacterium]